MNPDTIGMREKVQAIVAASLGTTTDNVCDEAKVNSPKWDDVHRFQILMAVEEAFGVKFAAEELGELNSVDDILRAIESRSVPAGGPQRSVSAATVIDVLKTVRPEGEFVGVQDLFAAGVLDSLDLTLLVSALEAHFDIVMNALDITPAHFRNVDSIIALMERYGVPA